METTCVGLGDVAIERRESVMARGRDIYIFDKGESVHTPKVCCNRKRESFNSKEREKASTLGKKRKSFNARGKKKELQCTRDKESFNVRENTHT